MRPGLRSPSVGRTPDSPSKQERAAKAPRLSKRSVAPLTSARARGVLDELFSPATPYQPPTNLLSPANGTSGAPPDTDDLSPVVVAHDAADAGPPLLPRALRFEEEKEYNTAICDADESTAPMVSQSQEAGAREGVVDVLDDEGDSDEEADTKRTLTVLNAWFHRGDAPSPAGGVIVSDTDKHVAALLDTLRGSGPRVLIVVPSARMAAWQAALRGMPHVRVHAGTPRPVWTFACMPGDISEAPTPCPAPLAALAAAHIVLTSHVTVQAAEWTPRATSAGGWLGKGSPGSPPPNTRRFSCLHQLKWTHLGEWQGGGMEMCVS